MGLYRQRVRRAIGKDPGSACHTRRASSLRRSARNREPICKRARCAWRECNTELYQMIQLFSGVATALERHKIRMRSVLDRGATRVESALGSRGDARGNGVDSHENWYRLRVPRSRRPGARWIMSKLAGIDRIPSLEKRLSQCGDDAMRACRCFPRSTVFKQTRLNGRGPTRRNHVDSCQNRTSGLRSQVIEARKPAGHGA